MSHRRLSEDILREKVTQSPRYALPRAEPESQLSEMRKHIPKPFAAAAARASSHGKAVLLSSRWMQAPIEAKGAHEAALAEPQEHRCEAQR